MSSRSLNKVQLIGNLTRDPELRYTPTGAAVCTIGLATNRSWTTESGEKKEETEFHRVVAWNKLAELCSQLLAKGRKIYVEGRLRTNSWQGQDGTQRSTTEVVIEDMIILDSRRPVVTEGEAPAAEVGSATVTAQPAPTKTQVTKKNEEKEEPKGDKGASENINPDDIPF
jgi:single-strand DNA-binding protein